jgi:hypothetical protein
MTRAFRFPSLHRQDSDEDFRRFLAQAKRHRLHDPWPQLADPQDFRYAWTQPLIRGFYVPTIRAEEPVVDLTSGSLASMPLSRRVAVYHEFMHLYLDFTPAKELARLCLGEAYRSLFELLWLPGSDWDEPMEASWSALKTMNMFLGEIAERIFLAEELIATAFGFDTAQSKADERSDGAAEREELRRLEETWVGRQGSEFAQLYYGDSGDGGFKKVARLLRREEPSAKTATIARLGIFSQAIRQFEDEFEALDSGERCREVVDAVRAMERAEELHDWIQARIVDETADWRAWHAILETSAEELEENQAVRYLWAIARGEAPFKPPDRAQFALIVQNRYLNSPGVVARWPNALIFPWFVDDCWYIVPALFEGYGDSYDLLIWEAFRQQLDARRGIRCPNVSVVGGQARCTCKLAYKPGVQRLARWATERRFGYGRWSDLPSPCNGGS